MTFKATPTSVQFAGHDAPLFELGEEVPVGDEEPLAAGGEAGVERPRHLRSTSGPVGELDHGAVVPLHQLVCSRGKQSHFLHYNDFKY